MTNTQNLTLLQDWVVVTIDDDPDSLSLISFILIHYGATVHTATNGAAGLEMIKAVRPDFVISDLSMPMMSGWDLIEALQMEPRLCGIPVFALTAHAMISDRAKALAAGFYNYLTKPLNVTTFMDQLLALLNDVPMLRERLQHA